jgi:hypothetical protein
MLAHLKHHLSRGSAPYRTSLACERESHLTLRRISDTKSEGQNICARIETLPRYLFPVTSSPPLFAADIRTHVRTAKSNLHASLFKLFRCLPLSVL